MWTIHYVVFLLVLVLLLIDYGQSTSDLEELVSRLSTRVEILEKRQQEDRIIIRALSGNRPQSDVPESGEKFDGNRRGESDAVKELRTETDSLRVDLRRLKSDVERIRERRDEMTALHQQAVAVRWLHKSLERVRAEIAEVAAAQNISASLRQQQKVDAQLQLLNADISWLRADAEQQRALHEQNTASLRQTQLDVQQVQQHHKHVNEELQKINEEMLKVQDEIKAKESADEVRDIDNAIQHWPVRVRHEKRLRKMLRDISTSQKTVDRQLRQLNHNQSNYVMETQQIRKEIAQLRNETQSQWSSKQSLLEAVRLRVISLESSNAETMLAVHNISILSSATEKLHASTIQLFEALESVESTCVNGVAMLRGELSKMEFNVAQLSSSVTVLREDENAYELTLKAPNHTKSVTNFPGVFNVENISSGTVTSIATEDPVARFLAEATNVQASVEKDEGLTWSQHLPFDCSYVDPSIRGSGVYLINPVPAHKTPLETFCEIQPNGLRWTVIQRHLDSSLDFDLTWAEYKTGFGDAASNFWLGNDAIHSITHKNPHMLRIDLWDHDGQYHFAEYSQFSIASEEEDYKLHLNGYHGNASNAFQLHNNAHFSTKDRDNDLSTQHCAQLYNGGWWYGRCQYVNVNSNVDAGFVWFDIDENVWLPLLRVEMKVRRI